ncbi:MAG: carboxylesterase family protein, partial [Pseudomonadota bacterium]
MTIIDTQLGKIQGKSLGNIQAYFGIRFGQAPVGDLRFKPAVTEGPWQGTYDATRVRHQAMQPPPMPFFTEIFGRPAEEPTYDEDCLFLNIYTPAADDNKRPVLYWIHGGGFTSGSGYDYDGRVLAEQGDVVVVTINYRLGLLGFMDMSAFGDAYQGSASNGVSDQILGLEWVRDNIADYGGDAGNVMIFGESAGAASVNGILAAPRADELYHRAIAHSGSTASTPPQPIAPLLAGHLGVEHDDLPAKLVGMSGEEIIAAQVAIGSGGGVCVDGAVVTRSTAQAIAERGTNGVP